jgi:predicted RNase H-like nuclease (RuvC/YqgF family)
MARTVAGDIRATERRRTTSEKTCSEQELEKLRRTLTDQMDQIRDLREQLNALKRIRREQAELQAELRELRSETRELTRVNREQAKKHESLKAEYVKLRARGGRQAA